MFSLSGFHASVGCLSWSPKHTQGCELITFPSRLCLWFRPRQPFQERTRQGHGDPFLTSWRGPWPTTFHQTLRTHVYAYVFVVRRKGPYPLFPPTVGIAICYAKTSIILTYKLMLLLVFAFLRFSIFGKIEVNGKRICFPWPFQLSVLMHFIGFHVFPLLGFHLFPVVSLRHVFLLGTIAMGRGQPPGPL